MKHEDIRKLSDEELKTQASQAAEQLFRIRFAKTLGKQDGVKNIKPLKIDIARIKTIARERELVAAKTATTTQTTTGKA